MTGTDVSGTNSDLLPLCVCRDLEEVVGANTLITIRTET